MEIAVNSVFSALNPKMTTVSHKHKHKQAVLNGFTPGSLRLSPHFRYDAPHQMKRRIHKYHPAVCAVISGVKDVGVSSSQFDDFSVAATSTSKGRQLKISVEIFGAKTQEIFDNVFDKMVAAAQPIPGFRRVKGGKTPNIPKDILLEVLGPSKVYEQVIKEVINSTIAEYVEKEGLKVSKDLRVEQSFEDLEATFEGMDIIGVISALAGAALVQILLGLPFLISHPIAYISRAFNLGHVFIHFWSVNFKFIPEPLFVSKELAVSLLIAHLVPLAAFTHYRWCKHEGGLLNFLHSRFVSLKKSGSSGSSFKIPNKEYIVTTMFVGNFIGIVCARSLHYQFYSWNFYSLPYLLWRTPFPTLLRIFLFIGVEICWNIYPSNAYSSALLLCLLLVILWGLWSAPSEHPYVDHKAHKEKRKEK